MSATEHKKIIERCVEEIWNQGKLATIDELIATNLLSNGLPVGRAGFRQFVTAMRTAFPDIHFAVEDTVVEGDKVMIRYTVRGTQQGALAGIPATGKQVQFPGIDIFRIADGQMAEEWLMYDQQALLQQIGAMPTKWQHSENSTLKNTQSIEELKAAISQKKVSFEQFVKAMYLLHMSPGEFKEHGLDFQKISEIFTDNYGNIMCFYYCEEKQFAALLTLQPCEAPPTRLDYLMAFMMGKSPNKNARQYHLFTDYTLGEHPELERLLIDCDHLAVESRRLLDGDDLDACHLMLYSIIKRILCLIDFHSRLERKSPAATTTDSSSLTKKEENHYLKNTNSTNIDAILELVSQQVKIVKNYHRRAAQLRAQSFYFSGMLFGIIFLLALMGLYLLLPPMQGFERQIFSSLIICGGLGAVVSIMSRMSSHSLVLDFEAGKSIIVRVGIFRPILGAIFALVAYGILQSGLLAVNILNTSAGGPNSTNSILFFYYVVGFLAGFSERWVPDIIEIAQKGVGDPTAQIKTG